MRPLIPLLFLVMLAGCAGNVQKLHDLNPPANDFASALASEYEAYADSEQEQGRSGAAEHYAGKGLKALSGEVVEPDGPDNSVPAQSQADLAEARAQLMKLETDDMKKVAGQKLARAQLLFDCWQHQLSKDLNQEQAPCAEEFHSTVAELQEISDTLTYGAEVTHTIVFAAHSAKLDEQAQNTITEIAGKVAHLPHYRVRLQVYAGIKPSQRHLTEMRLKAVRSALVKAGVQERHIRVKKFGSAKAVILSRDRAGMDTKKVIITVKTHLPGKEP